MDRRWNTAASLGDERLLVHPIPKELYPFVSSEEHLRLSASLVKEIIAMLSFSNVASEASEVTRTAMLLQSSILLAFLFLFPSNSNTNTYTWGKILSFRFSDQFCRFTREWNGKIAYRSTFRITFSCTTFWNGTMLFEAFLCESSL